MPGDSQGRKFNSSNPAIASLCTLAVLHTAFLRGFAGGRGTTLLYRAEDPGEVHVLSPTPRLGLSPSNLHGEFRHIIG